MLEAVLAAPGRIVRVDGRAWLDGRDVTHTLVWALTAGLLETDGQGVLRVTAAEQLQVAGVDAGLVLAGVG